ncbi:MAG: AzlD domain-containing protein [Dehalococcoidia bacterium]
MERLGLVLAVAVATYVTRVTGFYLSGRAFPPVFDRFLAYVPIAAFAALAAPGLEIGGDDMAARLIGVATAAVAALRFRQLWAAIVAGMGAFWVAGWLLPG